MNFTQAEYLQMEARLNANRRHSPVGNHQSSSESVERKLHDKIIAECQARGWICVHSRMDLPTTTEIGTPDFLILADHARLFILEAKSKTGKMKPDQLAFKAWAKKLGHETHVVRSLEDVLEIFKISR